MAEVGGDEGVVVEVDKGVDDVTDEMWVGRSTRESGSPNASSPLSRMAHKGQEEENG